MVSGLRSFLGLEPMAKEVMIFQQFSFWKKWEFSSMQKVEN